MSPINIPPGIRFLVAVIPKLCIIPFLILLVRRLLYPSLPTWITHVACVLAYPLVLAALVQYDVLRKYRKANSLGCELPPVVDSKLVGGFDMIVNMKEMHENRFPAYLSHVWALKYGPTYNMRALFKDRIFTCDPECIKRVLATEFSSFEKGPVFKGQFQGFLGDGVFNTDGDMWKFHRAMTRPFFARDRISHFDIFDRHTEGALRQINERMEEGVPFDFQELISRLTLDSASEFLLGIDVQSLSAGLSYPPTSPKATRNPSSSTSAARAFAKAFARAQYVTDHRPFYGQMWPLIEFWKDELTGPMKIIDEFILPLIARALEKKGAQITQRVDFNAELEADEDDTLLELLMKFTDDPKIIKDETLNILLAGRDTTAITLTCAVYVLSMHPDILKRLRAEVLDHVSAGHPTFDDIQKMKYLRAFVNEVLRLYPPVPYNIRCTVRDNIWPSAKKGGKPMLIEAGTEVLYSVMVMHRRTDLWGPDATEFDPDRFLDERSQKYLIANPFIFLPFNAGPRICLGQQFAYNEVSFVLIRLLQQFASIELAQEEANPTAVPSSEWATSPGSNGKDKVRLRPSLVMSVEGGLWVRMKRDNLAE